MDNLEIEGFVAIIFGLYLILHGLIHSAFISYSQDEKTGEYTGWSGDSWILSKFINKNYVELVGQTFWIIIIIMFIICGLGAIGIPGLNDSLSYLIIISSSLSIVAYILFLNGMAPTPYQWLIGLLIDLILMIYTLYFPSESTIFISILFGIAVIVFIVIFITKVLPEFGKNKQFSTV